MAALIAAIRHGEIAGAGIDVLPAEPPHPNDEIAVAYRNLKAAGIADRLILTPHAAWRSPLTDTQRAILFERRPGARRRDFAASATWRPDRVGAIRSRVPISPPAGRCGT